MNIGVVIWNRSSVDVSIDGEAVARVVRANPQLHPDVLFRIEHSVRKALETSIPDSTDFAERLRRQNSFPVALSETRHISLGGEDAPALQAGLRELTQRIVRPPQRLPVPTGLAARMLEQHIENLVQSQGVRRNYLFIRTGTGIPRSVDFATGPQANIAIDALRFDVRRADEIRLRADAEANKIRDILLRNDVRFIVFGWFSQLAEFKSASIEAITILQAAEAEVIDNVREVADLLIRATSGTRK